MQTTFEIQTNGAGLYDFTSCACGLDQWTGQRIADLDGATHLGLFVDPGKR